MKKGRGALKSMYKSPFSRGIFHSAPSVLFAAGTLALQGRSSLHIWALFLTVLLASQAHCLLLLLMDHWYDQHHLCCPQYDALACASVFPLVLSPLSFCSLVLRSKTLPGCSLANKVSHCPTPPNPPPNPDSKRPCSQARPPSPSLVAYSMLMPIALSRLGYKLCIYIRRS